MRFIYLYFIFLAMSVPAQQSTNRFEQAEYEQADNAHNNPPDVYAKDSESAKTNPADPAPIDDFLPLLVIAGIGLIAWKVRKRGITL